MAIDTSRGIGGRAVDLYSGQISREIFVGKIFENEEIYKQE